MERRRIILLGASNIAFAFPFLVASLRDSWPGNLEIVGAFGHGRSYGIESRVGFRRLPSLVHCGLWDYLSTLPRIPTQSILMDVGNDLLYGPSVGQISQWVETCLERLEELSSSTVMMRMPLDSASIIPEWKYRLICRLIYPACRKPLEQVREECFALDAQLEQLASAPRVEALEAPGHWYGIDPIHIRPRSQKAAWGSIFERWPMPGQVASQVSWRDRWRFWRLRPAQRWLFEDRQMTPQPCLETAHFRRPGTMSIALF